MKRFLEPLQANIKKQDRQPLRQLREFVSEFGVQSVRVLVGNMRHKKYNPPKPRLHVDKRAYYGLFDMRDWWQRYTRGENVTTNQTASTARAGLPDVPETHKIRVRAHRMPEPTPRDGGAA